MIRNALLLTLALTLACQGSPPANSSAPDAAQPGLADGVDDTTTFDVPAAALDCPHTLDLAAECDGASCAELDAGNPMICTDDAATGPGLDANAYKGGYKDIAVGHKGMCALRNDGLVTCWGLGFEPGEWGWLQGPPADKFTMIDAEGEVYCGLRVDGTARCWGSCKHVPCCGQPDVKLTTLSVGPAHVCGLKANGEAFCWGAGKTTNFWSYWPEPGEAYPIHELGQSLPPAGVKFKAISAGRYNTCGVRTDGGVSCWGAGKGQGSGYDVGQSLPPPDKDFTAVAACERKGFGLRGDGSVVCWGRCKGEDTYTPGTDTKYTALVCGSEQFVCGLTTYGLMHCWGTKCGYINGCDEEIKGTFVDVSAGTYNSCGLRADGSIVCWGHNSLWWWDEPP